MGTVYTLGGWATFWKGGRQGTFVGKPFDTQTNDVFVIDRTLEPAVSHAAEGGSSHRFERIHFLRPVSSLNGRRRTLSANEI